MYDSSRSPRQTRLFFFASASAIPPAVPGGERRIAYAPNGYFPAESPPVLPSRESLRADLRVLREAGFTGIVTYGAEIPAIPEIAHDLGFQAMLLGIWDPFDARALVLEPCVCIV